MTTQGPPPSKIAEEKTELNKAFLISTSLFTLIIACSQSYIAYKQYEASKLNFSPIFIFQEELVKKIDSGKYDSENLKIINMGYPINNYSSSAYTLIKATKKITKEDVRNKSVLIPVNFYAASFSSTGGKDMLEKFVGVENNTEYNKLRKSINSFSSKKLGAEPSYSIELIKAFKITYSDIEGVEHVKYFINQKPVNGDFFKYIKEFSDKTTTTKEMKELNADFVVSLLNKTYGE